MIKNVESKRYDADRVPYFLQDRFLGSFMVSCGSYLYRISELRIEDVVDEMLAIQSDRNAIIQKKELEQAQAAINRMYREGLGSER